MAAAAGSLRRVKKSVSSHATKARNKVTAVANDERVSASQPSASTSAKTSTIQLCATSAMIPIRMATRTQRTTTSENRRDCDSGSETASSTDGAGTATLGRVR